MDSRYYCLLLILLFADCASNTNISIDQSSSYKSLRECAALCLNDAQTYVDVRSFIGCPAQPYGQNECYCREDLHSSASEYITYCVTSACGSSTADVQGAISVFNNYCFTAVGATPVIAAVAASTTAATASVLGATTVTTTSNGVVETSTNTVLQPATTSSANNSGGKGISLSDKISLGVGIGFGVPSVIGVFIGWVMCMRSG